MLPLVLLAWAAPLLVRGSPAPAPDPAAYYAAGAASHALSANQVAAVLKFPFAATAEASGGSGTLVAGQSLAQDTRLYSSDGSIFLVVQSVDGNMVLYNTAAYAQYGATSAAAIWGAASYSSSAPFTLTMRQDCNLVIYGGNMPTWASMTQGEGYDSQGYAPCSALVTTADGGYLAVLNSVGSILFTSSPPSPYMGGGQGVLDAGRTMNQEYGVTSADGSMLLMPQADGNLVLYNTARYVASGAEPAAAIWASGTNGAFGGPFRLVMQPDCNLVLYSTYLQQYYGNAGPAAVWQSGTYGRGSPPCHLVVSNAGSGSFAVVDANGAQLFSAP